MSRFDSFAVLAAQCKTDQDVLIILPVMNALYPEVSVARRTEEPKAKNRKRARKRAKLAVHAWLDRWPRKAIEHLGCATSQEVWDYMKEKSADYLLPVGYELAAIERFFSRNRGLNRTYQRDQHGSWSFSRRRVIPFERAQADIA
jgi:hypothetical protein